MVMNQQLTMRMDCEYTYVPLAGARSIEWIEALLWCEEFDGIGHFSMGGHGIYFENEKDAIMFTLINS
jgi:hypothetical protein